MSCAVAPGSPVFSPSRLLLPGAPDHHHGASNSPFLPASPLRFFALRARIRPDPPCAKPQPQPQPPAPTTPTAAPALKRRRPAPLLVPVAVPAPPPVLAAANGAMTDEVAEQGDGFAAYCRKGKGRKRVEMEDRHVAAVALGGDRGQALFGVFDGHGGKSAAEFAAGNMARIMAEELKRGGGAEEAARRAYLRTDQEFSCSSAEDVEAPSGGACCVTALLRESGNGRRQLVVSGAGDCRAVLSRGGRAEALTDDHRASRRDERDRIEALRGGLVLNCRGVWRVQGSLAVTRGIGDAHLKPWVVAEPETATVDVDDRCDLLILASDGLWDKVGNQEAVDVAAAACSGGLPAACRRLVEMAAARGSTDDISVLVINLQRPLR
ncbi:probable protein phosphatase 2C 32 [Lolium rigidum]|uniref:probable protein phosphatase 2C 32 n=1 Tax=Lolium rigidum TaxID=89674 RepID=UPI001F5C6791|nr:probable protein phosphatase 2C 32 [Lolium rigidum]